MIMNEVQKTSKITIRPFIEGSDSNMGLTNYQMVVFEGVLHEEPLMCYNNNGIKRYVTGLNEFAPEVKQIKDESEKEAVIKEIRRVVAALERELATNVIDENDPEFWHKVKILRPDNEAFWESIVLRCGNDPVYLNPSASTDDLIKLKAIEAGGFSMVARSLEEARKRPSHNRAKFYLDRFEDTIAIKTEVKKLRNKALGLLQTMFDKHPNKLFLVCKLLDSGSLQYTKMTPNDVLYDNMDKYINGETAQKDKKKTAQYFIDAASSDVETLKFKVYAKDAIALKIIALRGDGFFYHLPSNTMIGKTQSDIIEFLKNPINDELLKDLSYTIEQTWNA